MVTLESMNVVLARANPALGRAEVIESWRGDIRAGSVIAVPDIAAIASDTKRLVYEQARPTRRRLGTDQVILFLKAKEDGVYRVARGAAVLSLAIVEDKRVWAPALPRSYDGFGELGLDASQVHARVTLLGAGLDEIAAAAKLKGAASAEAVAPLVLSSIDGLRWRAEAALRALGNPAAPTLHRLLRRRLPAGVDGELISILNEVAKDECGQEIARLLEEESRFWRRVGPQLDEGWVQGAGVSGANEMAFLRERLGRTRMLLCWADAVRDTKSLDAATHLRDFWKGEKRLVPAAASIGLVIAPNE